MINPQPNYSGVTIQISNPAVNVGSDTNCNPQFAQNRNEGACTCPHCYPPNYYMDLNNGAKYPANFTPSLYQQELPKMATQTAYPPQYYLNNYNYQNNGDKDSLQKLQNEIEKISNNPATSPETEPLTSKDKQNNLMQQNISEKYNDENEEQDFSKSQAVIDDLNSRAEAIAKEKKNTKQKRVVALTDEYIKSLENYLDNPDSEIRLMASKEILTRLDEDKDRFNDAALNALLNKMLQDPSKLIRVAALSAFASRLASGNDYTIELLQNIQSNPSADKEDILQASDILLKMSSVTELKNIPYNVTPQNNNIEKEEEEKLNIEPINRAEM